MAKLFCQPVLELWLANEVSQGRIACPGFFADRAIRAAWCASMWTGDGPGSVDPLKEVTAAEKRVNMEISTLQAESILHDGQDWEAKHRQRTKEVALQKRDGTAPAAAPGTAPVNADPSVDPNADPNADPTAPEDKTDDPAYDQQDDNAAELQRRMRR